METKNAIIYVRASTSKQGNSLILQQTLCERFADKHGYNVIAIYTETASGGDNTRPEFNNALNSCRDNDYTFIALKIDRVARRISAIGQIIDSGVRLRIVQIGDNEVNKMILAVFAAMAETERDLIKQRTIEALRFKKEQGVILGNPNIHLAQAASRSKRSALADAYNAETLKVIDEIKASGIITNNGIAVALNRRGYKTRRGNNFYSESVRRILKAA